MPVHDYTEEEIDAEPKPPLENTHFSKSDLRTGMLVQFRNDKRYMVLLDYQFPETNKIGILLGEQPCLPLDKFDEDLNYIGSKKKSKRI